MNIQVSDKGHVLSLDVKSIFIETSINLLFSHDSQSLEAFHKLKGINIQCYHVGKNAPHGPYVAVYPSENKDTTVLIQ